MKRIDEIAIRLARLLMAEGSQAWGENFRVYLDLQGEREIVVRACIYWKNRNCSMSYRLDERAPVEKTPVDVIAQRIAADMLHALKKSRPTAVGA